MSSDSERDIGDYITDNSVTEEGTLFLPAPNGRPDSWSFFFGGILIGMAGGGLVTLAPWLGGSLILVGYGTTAFTLVGSRRRFGRALRFGFVIAALFGAVLLAGDIVATGPTWHVISAIGERHLFFPSFVLMPWVIGPFRYLYLRLNKTRLPHAPERLPADKVY